MNYQRDSVQSNVQEEQSVKQKKNSKQSTSNSEKIKKAGLEKGGSEPYDGSKTDSTGQALLEIFRAEHERLRASINVMWEINLQNTKHPRFFINLVNCQVLPKQLMGYLTSMKNHVSHKDLGVEMDLVENSKSRGIRYLKLYHRMVSKKNDGINPYFKETKEAITNLKQLDRVATNTWLHAYNTYTDAYPSQENCHED